MNENELQRKIRELSPEFLKKLIAYWNDTVQNFV